METQSYNLWALKSFFLNGWARKKNKTSVLQKKNNTADTSVSAWNHLATTKT